MANTENKRSTVDKAIGLLIDGVELYSPSVLNESIYFGEISSIDILNSGSGYDVINPPELEVLDTEGYGKNAKIHPNLKGKLTEVLVLNAGIGYERKPTLSLIGGNFKGSVELETNLIKKSLTASFAPTPVSVSSTTITFISPHNFEDGEEVIYNTNSFPSVVGLVTSSSYFAGIVNATTISLYKKDTDALSKINVINNLNVVSGVNTGIQEFSTKVVKNIIDKVYINSFDGELYNKAVRIPSIEYNDSIKENSINTSDDYIYAKNHNLNEKDLIVYSSTGSVIAGLASTTNYYVTVLDDNTFKLSNAGAEDIPDDTNYINKNYVSLNSVGVGTHTFKYQPITIKVSTIPGSKYSTPPIIEPIVLGEVESIFIENYGVGYGISEVINLNVHPIIQITNSNRSSTDFTREAVLQPIIIDGKIVEVQVLNQGENYSKDIDILVNGIGKYAKLYPIVSQGKITEVLILSSGSGYVNGKTLLEIIPRGKDLKLLGNLTKWTIDQYFKNKNLIDNTSKNGYVIPSRNVKNSLQFINLFPSQELRESIKDIPEANSSSPILGWSYDGNPIFGPYLIDNGVLTTYNSGYRLKTNLLDQSNQLKRPLLTEDKFPVGYFIEDYEYVEGISSLDESNGAYLTNHPDFPDGTYAYFMTIDSVLGQNPVYPYVIGNYFKNEPYDKNYDSTYNQNIDFKSKSYVKNNNPLYLTSTTSGYEYLQKVQSKYKQEIIVKDIFGSKVDEVKILTSGSNYKVNDEIIFSIEDTQNEPPNAYISKLNGKNISNFVVGITTFQNVIFKNENNTIIGFHTSPHNIENGNFLIISGSIESKLNSNNKVTVRTKTVELQSNHNDSGITTHIKVDDISGFSVDDYIQIDSEVVQILQIYPEQSKFFVYRLGTIGSHTSGVSKVTLLPTKFEFSNNSISYPLSIINKHYINPKNSVGLGTTGSIIQNNDTNKTYSVPPRSIYIENHQFSSNQPLIYNKGPGINGLLLSESGTGGSTFRLNDGQTVYAVNNGRNYLGISTVGFGSTSLYFRESSYISDEFHSFSYIGTSITAKVELTTLNVTTEENHGLLSNDLVRFEGKDNEWEYYAIKFDLNNNYKIKKTSNTTFNINLYSKPQFITYPENNSLPQKQFNPFNVSYITDSKNAKGSISDVNIRYTGSSYKNTPIVEAILSDEGENAILLAYSSKIGKIDSIERIKDGFDYPSDVTLEPKLSTNTICYLDEINRIDKVNVLYGGRNYNTAPRLKVIGNDKAIIEAKLRGSTVDSVIVNSNVYNLSTPLPIIPIDNSNGFDILNIYPVSATVNRIELDINEFPLIYKDYGDPVVELPFKIGDSIFIENCRVEDENTLNYNSLDLIPPNVQNVNQLFFSVVGVDTSLGRIEYSISNVGIGSSLFGDYTTFNGYGTVVNKDILAQFEMKIIKNNYVPGEYVKVLDSENNIKFSGQVPIENGWDVKRNQLRITDSNGILEIGDVLLGESSLLEGRVLYSNSSTMKSSLNSSRDKINYVGKNADDLNSDLMRIQDSFYYQDFSYSIRGKTPYETWKESVKSIVHPSGFKEFADVQLESQPSETLKVKTTDTTLEFNVEIENENSFFTRKNYTIAYEDEKINPTTTERIYFGSDGDTWPVAGYGRTFVEGISLLPYLLNKTNNVIRLKDISSQFNGTYEYESLGFYDVEFKSSDPYYLGISTVGLEDGDIIGYSTYHEYPNNTKILSVGINSIKTLYPHKVYSGIVTESLEVVRILNQNNLIGISSFSLLAENQTPIYKVVGFSTNINVSSDTIELFHNFETGQKVYYENIAGQPIGIVTTSEVIGGISTDIMPSTVYAIKIASNKFRLSGLSTSQKLGITTSGSGIHKFTFDSPNASTLISIDNIIQTPVHYRGLSVGLSAGVGIGTTVVYVSPGISSITSIDILKIENEYLKVKSIGLTSTNSIEVERGFLGTNDSSHTGINTAYIYRGNYLINEDIIYFTSPPFGPTGLPGIEISSKFAGRAFSRTFSDNRPNDRNIVLDDISDEFIGITSFILKENGNKVVGLYTNTNDPDLININNNPLILINNVPQVTNFDFDIFEVNQNKIKFLSGIPKIGKILTVVSNSGYGYMPLVAAAATVSVSLAGTISQVYLNGAGSGYRGSPVISIASTVGTGASISAIVGASGTITGFSIVNPGVGYSASSIPDIIIDSPLPYYDMDLEYASGYSGVGTNGKATVSVGSGSSIQFFEVTSSGENYKVGDVLNVVGLVTNTSIGSSFTNFQMTVKETISDTFSGIYPGQFLQFDDISSKFNSVRKAFDITTTIGGIKIRLTFRTKNKSIDVSNNLFIFINDVLQIPGESYRYIAGRIVFTEPPKAESKCNILYYQGSIYDTELVIPLQTIKEGDEVKFEDSELSLLDFEQTERVVKRLITPSSLDTFPYSGIGITSIVRPISWTKQKNDKLISGSYISKSRENQLSKIYPVANLIKNATKTDTSIYVDNAYPLFIELDNGTQGLTEDKRLVKILKNNDSNVPLISVSVSGATTISNVSVIDGGNGYDFTPIITLSNPSILDPLYNWNTISGISTSYSFNSIVQGDILVSVGNSNLVAISTNIVSWNLDSLGYSSNVDLQRVAVSTNNSYVSVGSSGKIFKKQNKNSPWILCGIKTEILTSFNFILGLGDSSYDGTFNDIIYNENIDSWIAVGESGKIYKGVGIGTTVFVEAVSHNVNYKAVDYNSDVIVAVGHSAINRSINGRDWFQIPSAPSNEYNDVIWDGNKFITVSNVGIYTATDPNIWNLVIGSPSNLVKISKYNETYIGIDTSGNVYSSFDIIEWRSVGNPLSNQVKEIKTTYLDYKYYQTAVGVAGTILYAVPTLHSANLTAVMSGESLASVNIVDGGFGYLIDNPPKSTIQTPPSQTETLYSVNAVGDFGKIVGIKTSNTGIGTNTPSIKFELITDYSSSGYDSLNTFGINYSQLSIGDYFIITNSNIAPTSGFAFTGITTSLGGMGNYPTSKIGTATSFLDGVYRVEYVETTTVPQGIVTVTCHTYPINGGIGIDTSSATINYYGNYSWSKIINYENRAIRTPLNFTVDTDNGLTGLTTSPSMYRIPPLIF